MHPGITLIFQSSAKVFHKALDYTSIQFYLEYQGWIQTSATSFQKLVRIVKDLKKNYKQTESHARKSQPLDANSSQVFSYRIWLLPTALHLFPASSGPATSVALSPVLTLPPPPLQICAQYVHQCKVSIVSCALVKTLFHLLSIIVHQSKSLFIGCCDSVHQS